MKGFWVSRLSRYASIPTQLRSGDTLKNACGALLVCLLAACTPATTATVTPLPTTLPTLVASSTPYVRPTLPPAFTPAVTTTASGTVAPTAVQIEPLTGIKVAPPLSITLPDGWQFGYDTMLYTDVGDVTSVPLALYQGPVTGGTGTIVLLWNFRSVMVMDQTQPNMWVDGLRLLRSLVFDPTCNIGTDPQRDFSVGGLPAIGTNFRAVDCPASPNTKGWFAGVTVNDVNYVFYLYTDPIEIMTGQVPYDLQAILDSVVFDVNAPQ